ncbi:hypothetical protein B0H11DRAFT_2235259 [Mycena galericulata]|nr:hypothetical protein B0H11DRAFT_2235259 [Mycena galericulata]
MPRHVNIHPAKQRFLTSHLEMYLAAQRARRVDRTWDAIITQYFRTFGVYPLDTDPLDRAWDDSEERTLSQECERRELVKRIVWKIRNWYRYYPL